MLSVDAMRREIEAIRARTRRPFNVNFFCHSPPTHDAKRDAAWRATLAPYFAEFKLDARNVPTAPARMPFDATYADALAPFAPPIVSFHFGLPSPDLVARVKSWGSKVISSATTVAEALWLEARGVDAIVAQGFEAGGHRGIFLTDDVTTQIGTFALLPQIVRAVRVPVIAAGGIADAKGVAAALALGAAAVQIGTAYLCCDEATTTPLHRAALTSDAARHTAVTNVFTGRPARGIVNRIVREIGPMCASAPQFPLAATAIAVLRAKSEAAGSADFSPLWSGQNATGCRAIAAARMTRDLASGL
jgi:nitronate monooxygenase